MALRNGLFLVCELGFTRATGKNYKKLTKPPES
jgi:hypothetical protein